MKLGGLQIEPIGFDQLDDIQEIVEKAMELALL